MPTKSKRSPTKADARDRFGGVGSDTVADRTGRPWREWFAILDKAGARRMTHREIAAYLHERQKVPGWWAQMVTVGYEQARGMREANETPEGFQVSASRTILAPVPKIYRACTDPRTRAKWLGNAPLEITTANKDKTLRGAWKGGTRVEVYFVAKGKGRSQINVQHRRLASAADVSRMRDYWGRNLDRLKAAVEP